MPRIRAADDTHYFDEEEEISDWSESHDTDGFSDDMTPTLPLDLQQHQQQRQDAPSQHFTNSNLTLPPNHAYMASMPATMGFSYMPSPQQTGNPYSTQAQHPLTTFPQTPLLPQHRHEAASLFLRPLRRSIQKWALAAIAVPYDSTRLHGLDSQIEALPGLDLQDKSRLRQFIRLFGRHDRKRPRDRLLRDRQTKGVVMDVRKKTAFLGYTWRRMRPVEERPTILPEEASRQRSGGAGVFDGGHGDSSFYGLGQQYGGALPGQYDYGYGWWGGIGGGGQHWGQVSNVKAVHGRGRFSWR